jgi:hypothetical protein
MIVPSKLQPYIGRPPAIEVYQTFGLYLLLRNGALDLIKQIPPRNVDRGRASRIQ